MSNQTNERYQYPPANYLSYTNSQITSQNPMSPSSQPLEVSFPNNVMIHKLIVV